MDEPVVFDSTLVKSVSDLPECNSKNEGASYMVAGLDSLYFCLKGSWTTGVEKSVGVSCHDGVLYAGAETPAGTGAGSSESSEEKTPGYFDFAPTGTGSAYRRSGLDLSGFAQKGPFRYGASIHVLELDSARRLEASGRSSKACVTSSDGSFQMENLDLVSPYVRLQVEGFFLNELTGGLSSSLVTLESVTDLTERDSVNVNLLTHLEAPRVMQLVSNSGGNQPIRNMKSQSLREVLGAFEISLGSGSQGQGGGQSNPFGWGFGQHQQQNSTTSGRWADDLTLFGEDDYSAALLAVTIMMQSRGSGSEMMSYVNQVAERIKGNGNWDDNNAKAELADWLMVQDTSGNYERIRRNMEAWKLGKVPDFEKYLRNFWPKIYGFDACGTMNAGQVRAVNNSLSSFFVSYYEDPKGPRIRFICDRKEHRWRAATDIEKDTLGFGYGEFDGQIKNGKVNADKNYIYESAQKSWRMATNDDIREFVDVRTVFDSLAADESVVYVLRHAERTDDTGKNGHLNDKGKKQSVQVGQKFKGIDLYLGNSGFTRTIETCEGIGEGSGMSKVEQDSLPFLNGDWFVKDADKLESYRNSDGGGWVVFSKYAYQGGYTDALYNMEDRAKELIYDEIVPYLPKMKRVSFLISHDQMVLPLVVYSTEGKINLRYYENQNWINYLAGVAVIVDGKGGVRLVPVKGLDSGIMH